MSDRTGSPGDEPTTSPSSPTGAPADEPPVEPDAADELPGAVERPVEPEGAVAPEVAGEAEEVEGDGTTPAAEEMQPVAVPGEQIEWQPVASGDAITWQPVVSPADEGIAGPDFVVDEPVDEPVDDSADDAGALTTAGAATASNGAAGAGFEPDTPRPRPSAGAQSVAARRRAAAASRPTPTAGSGTGGSPGGTAGDDGGQAAKDKTRRQVILLSVATAGVVLVGVLAFVLSRGALDEGERAEGPATTPTSVRTAPTLAPTEFQGYRDDVAGFSLRYPKTWVKYVPPASDMRLAVAIQPPDTDGFWIRVLPIQTVATEENIGNFKAVTDTVVFGDGSAKLIQEQLVRVNGRLAYYYLYTFEDEATRNEGIHAHYFIFDGLRIFSLVFQSVPADDFTRQAGIFDQIAESFVPEQPRPGATTTSPPTSTP